MTGEDESPYDKGLQGAIQQAEIEEASRRRFFYADVEVLVSVGVLTHTIEFDDLTITFRSLPSSARDRLASRGHNNSALSWFLSESVHMVDGLLIGEDPNATYLLHKEWASRLPAQVLTSLISIPVGLNRRVDRAALLAEAFAYEPFSRSYIYRSDPCADNIVRTIWKAHIEADDVFEKDFVQWNHTVTIVTAMAGSKGANSVTEGLAKLRQKEKSRRNDVIERSINEIIGNRAEAPSVTVEFDGKVFNVPHVLSPTTVDDLFREMDQVMHGRKDYHDEIVDRYKKEIRDRIEAQRQEFQAISQQAARIVAEEQGSDRPALVGYTPDQLSQLRPDALEPHRAMIVDQSGANRLYDRYLSSDTKVGWLNGSGDPEEAQLRRQASQGEADPDHPGSLQSKITGRRPTLRSDSDDGA